MPTPSHAPTTDGSELPRCAVLGTLDLLHDVWTLGILRCVFFGIRRYTAIQRELGIATNVLADRLDRLVRLGLLERVAYQERPVRHEYVPTPKGGALGDVVVALRDWGAEHLELAEPLGPLRHVGCGGAVHAAATCAACRQPVAWDEVAGGPQRRAT